MLIGIEFVLSLAAIGLGILLFVAGLKRRHVAVGRRNVDPSDDNVIATNFFALAIIGLLFFGGAFLVDVFT